MLSLLTTDMTPVLEKRKPCWWMTSMTPVKTSFCHQGIWHKRGQVFRRKAASLTERLKLAPSRSSLLTKSRRGILERWADSQTRSV